MLKTATVRFDNDYGKSKEYAYITALGDLKKGDLVVVEARDWYQVATFERYKEVKSATKNIIQKIDVEEAQRIRRAHERKLELLDRIEMRVKEIEEGEMLQKLAEKDGVIRELVSELNEIEDK